MGLLLLGLFIRCFSMASLSFHSFSPFFSFFFLSISCSFFSLWLLLVIHFIHPSPAPPFTAGTSLVACTDQSLLGSGTAGILAWQPTACTRRPHRTDAS